MGLAVEKYQWSVYKKVFLKCIIADLTSTFLSVH